MADTTSIYTDPSNMDKANVQLCIWNGTKWVELSNGKTINTINANISSIADKVKEAQKGIAQATTDAQNAVDTARNAITSAVGTNLIIAASVTNNMSMDNNGANAGYPTTFITDYIQVVAGENYTISTTLNSSISRVAFYDSSKTFMSRLADQGISNTVSQTITIPTGVSFIRFSPNEDNGKYENNFKFEKGSNASDWNANPADNATVTALSEVSQKVNSFQYELDGKVDSKAYQSDYTQLSNDINLRVKTDDLLSQINIESGNVLIQSKKIYLDASSVVFGGTAFITSAMISSLSTDDIVTGTLSAGDINLGNGTFKVDTKGNLTSSNATITGGSLKVGSNFSVDTSGILTASGATINGNLNVNSSGNLTTIDSNGFHNYDGDGNDIYIKNGTFKSTMYDEAYNATTSIEVQEGKLVAAYNDENISIYVGRQTAPVILWSDGSQIESSSGSLAVNSDKDMQFSSSSGDINFNSPSGTNVTFQPNGGGGVVFGALANFTKNAIVGNDQSGDQIWVRGAGNFNGKVSCQSLTQTSLLSKKANITKLNIQDVINAVNSTEIYEYSFKRDLEQGVNKRYASYIIDDVNEVAQYKEPSEFLSDDKQGRDDGTQLAYLTLMVQEMYKEIQELKNK